MADKGIMIELRVNTHRIGQLAPLHLDTALTPLGAMAAIAAPNSGTFRGLGPCAQQRLGRRLGLQLPILDEARFADAAALGRHVIALGHAANNGLLRRLHYLRYLTDHDYPVAGLRVVSIHNPFGDGFNVIAVLGATPAAVRRGLRRLLEKLVLRDGVWLIDQRLHEIEPVPESGDPQKLLAEEATRDPSSYGGRPSSFLKALDQLNLAGEERWARAFMTLVTPYATGEIKLSFWLMSAVDFWTDRLVIGWDLAEEFPFFSTAERLLIANFIASCTEYCHESITLQKWRVTESDFQVFNHHTFPSKGLYFGCQYLRKHGYSVVPLDPWLEASTRAFARAAQAGRSYDEGGSGYSWLVGNHLLEVAFARADFSYVRSGRIKRYADLATVIQNNRFELVPFGDCGSYHNSASSAGNILLRAAEWHRDHGFKWIAGKCAPATTAADIMTRELHDKPPRRHVGLFVLPMDPVIHRWANLPHFPNYPPPLRGTNVPVARCFDKISLRGGWTPKDDYLLLKGFGAGQHGHPDANGISQYQVRGRLFLAESDYIRRMPKQHNMVMVIREGQHAPVPVTARLDTARPFRGGALTSTTLVDYNGCDWTRSLVWLNRDCLLVVDTLRARTPGDYEFRCYWRTLGSADLTARGLHAEHAGEHFHVIELSESARRLDSEALPLNATAYPHYAYGAAVPRILCERRTLELAAGEEVCFVNLLLPTGTNDVARRTITWAEPGVILVSGVGPAIRVSPDEVQVGRRLRHRFSRGQTLTALSAAAPPRAGIAAVPRPPPAIPQVRWQTRLPATASALAPLPDGGALVGCEDGSFLAVDSRGKIRRLAKAEARVGAVLAGCLYGEPEPTYMATGHDGTVRFISPDGSERMNVTLPRNAHMPAWGRALALANLDGDGKLWPVVGTAAWRVHPIRADGSLRWTFDTTAHAVTCLAAADLNRDGRDEIAIGTVYFCIPAATADGARLWQDEDYNDFWRAGPVFPFILARDVDADGDLEVITVGSDTFIHCISHTGEKKWTYSIGDEAAGLALLGDRIAAASMTGDVHGVDGQGKPLWRRGLGSPCTALANAGSALVAATEARRVAWLQADGTVSAAGLLPGAAIHLVGRPDASVLAATVDGQLALLAP